MLWSPPSFVTEVGVTPSLRAEEANNVGMSLLGSSHQRGYVISISAVGIAVVLLHKILDHQEVAYEASKMEGGPPSQSDSIR